MVDSVAKELFPQSQYVGQLLDDFALLTPRPTVAAAERSLKTLTRTYLRLCKRRAWPMVLADQYLMRYIQKVLPRPVAGRCRELAELDLSPAEMFARARVFESALVDEHGLYAEPVGSSATFPAVPSQSREPNRPCFGCGDNGHWYRQCPMKKHRCGKCNKMGHADVVCPNLVLTDQAGRPSTVVQPRPSGTHVQTRQDRTQADRLLTAEAVMKVLKDLMMQKSVKAREYRQKRDLQRKRQMNANSVPLPTSAAATDDYSGDIDPSQIEAIFSNSDSDMLDNYVVDPFCQESNVIVPGTLNGAEIDFVADSGAAVSVISDALASRIGVRATSNPRPACGTGNGCRLYESPGNLAPRRANQGGDLCHHFL